MSNTSAPREPTWRKILSLLSDAVVYGASSALSQVIGLILLPIYSRFLTPEDYGIVAMLTVLTALFVPLANLGMSNAIFRRFNLCKEESERVNVLTIGLLSITVVSIALGVTGMVFARELSTILTGLPDYSRLVQWGLFGAIFHSIGAVPEVVLRADRRVKAMAGFNIFKVLVTATVTLILLLVVGMRAEGVVLGMMTGDVCVTVATFAATARRFGLVIHDAAVVRAMFSYGLPFVPHRLQSIGITMLGQYLVRTYLGLTDAGLYNVALKLTVPLVFVVAAIQKAWVPFKFQIHAQDNNPKEFFRTVFTYYCAGITYLWLGVSVWGPEALRLLTDPKFHAAAPLVPFLAAITLARGFRFMVGTGIELGDNTRLIAVSSFFGLVTSAVGGIVLIHFFGIPGAALGATLAWLVMGAILFPIAQRTYRIRYDWPVVASLFAVSIALVTVDLLAQHTLNLWGRLGLALLLSLVYPAIVFAVLSRSATERARMRSLIAHARRLRSGSSKTGAKAQQQSVAAPPVDDDAIQSDPTSANV